MEDPAKPGIAFGTPAAPTTTSAPTAATPKPEAKPELVMPRGRNIEIKGASGWGLGEFAKLKSSEVFRFAGDTTEWTVVGVSAAGDSVHATHN